MREFVEQVALMRRATPPRMPFALEGLASPINPDDGDGDEDAQ